MRVIEVFDEAVRTVAVSPDGRFLAAGGSRELAVVNWLSGEVLTRAHGSVALGQLAFTADGHWVVFADRSGLYRLATVALKPIVVSGARFAGGVAVAPDGKTLAVAEAGGRQDIELYRWELPAWRPAPGFNYWSPFTRLAFSPNGEFLAGIDNDTFELRIAVTGGLNGRHRVRYAGDGFLAFARDSRSVVFGWETNLHVMESRAGTMQRRVSSPGEAFRDAAFVGSGRHLVTVDGTGVMRMWSAESWEVVRGYDWATGRLTCVTATADGLAGVCGTDTGKLVVFDVDE
jgi:WD40 repeat protein